jgi:hypothetical protein
VQFFFSLKELALTLLVYTGVLFSQYLVDFVQVGLDVCQ